MLETLNDAREELKRVDHLVYVSLKYTRTVDVLLNCVHRMIDAYNFMFELVLKKALEEAKIPEIPKTPLERVSAIRELYPDDQQFDDNLGLFLLLRKIAKSQNFDKEQEYRRHVTMRTMINGQEELLNIDIVTSYFQSIVQFFKRLESDLVQNTNFLEQEDE